MTSDWEWETEGSSGEALRSVSSYTGCSSLVDTAIRRALVHSISITAETLEEIPWEVASLLWERLVASYARSWHLAGTKKANNTCKRIGQCENLEGFCCRVPGSTRRYVETKTSCHC